MFRFTWGSNVYIKSTMHWFQFPQIQELTSSTVTSFIWQCYSFNVHSVLFILPKILFVCWTKELCFWWTFSCLVSLIGGLENESDVKKFTENVIVDSTLRLALVLSG